MMCLFICPCPRAFWFEPSNSSLGLTPAPAHCSNHMAEEQNSTLPEVTHKLCWKIVRKLINGHPSFRLASKQLYHQEAEALPALLLPLVCATQAQTDQHCSARAGARQSCEMAPDYTRSHQTGPGRRNGSQHSPYSVFRARTLLSYLLLFSLPTSSVVWRESCVPTYPLKNIFFSLSYIAWNYVTCFFMYMLIFLFLWKYKHQEGTERVSFIIESPALE